MVIGFYVSWDPASRDSLQRNGPQLTHVAPEWLRLSADGAGFVDTRTRDDRSLAEPLMREQKLAILPLLNNYLPGSGWSSAAVHGLVSDAQTRETFAARLRDYLTEARWQGVVLDLESVAEEDRGGLVELVRALAGAFKPAGLVLGQAVQQASRGFDLKQLAAHADFLVPMVYDEHWAGDARGAGSIAGIPWTREQLQRVFAQVAPEKVVVGLGNYAYDWAEGEPQAQSIRHADAVERARQALAESGGSDGAITLDPLALNATYRYTAADGTRHTVWLLDAVSAYNQWTLAWPYRPRGAALWRLGAEDPAVWEVIGRAAIGQSAGNGATVARLREAAGVRRTLEMDSDSGLIVSGRYEL
ncbi:MAG: glycosyl hydrolase family 18 protein [Chloroflexota bacterium]